MDEQKKNINRKDQFESDSHKLVQKHMADQNHKITDEELANVRVGMSPGPDVPTQQAISESEDRIADEKRIEEDKLVPGAQKITPWDTLQP
jgi:hypothetical protein